MPPSLALHGALFHRGPSKKKKREKRSRFILDVHGRYEGREAVRGEGGEVVDLSLARV